MSKHTSGPWKAENRPGVGWIVRWDNPESQICSLRWIGGPHLPEVDRIVEADARLIAVTPDLLEAVIKAAIPLEAIYASVHWELAEELKDTVVDAVLAIRKVIDKMEESP